MTLETKEFTTSEYDAEAHYGLRRGPLNEFGQAPECPAEIRNVGWTLGNDCPYRCTHCYSMSARRKGRDLSVEMIDRIVHQLAINEIETVNLGGNEPLFTNGPKASATLLPYIVERLVECNIEVGLTTSGITLRHLWRNHPAAFARLNDVDVSLDSPFEAEHNTNRGAPLFREALEALEICRNAGIPRTIVMCGMNWNFSHEHLEALIDLARCYDANVRINPLKPVEAVHMASALSAEQYYSGFSLLMARCRPVDLGESPIAAISDYQQARRCPCGRTSFRIHSLTPAGAVHVSPCVYLHDYKSTLDLLQHNLVEIIASPEFRVFRQRNFNPNMVVGCEGCVFQRSCGGGCAARSYLHEAHTTKLLTMRARDPYCPRDVAPNAPFPQKPSIDSSQRLVHMDYLCTWIGTPC
jgi:radical SAM protein with 4Fe4S-binding SPASM domain